MLEDDLIRQHRNYRLSIATHIKKNTLKKNFLQNNIILGDHQQMKNYVLSLGISIVKLFPLWKSKQVHPHFTPPHRNKKSENLKKTIILTPTIIILSMLVPALCFAEKTENGETVYKINCTPCHGITGEGNGPKAVELKTKPLDHTNATYMSTRTDEQLEYVIRNGGISISKSPIMPAWKDTLSDKQIKAVIKYLRKLCACKFDSIVSDPKLRIVDLEFRE